MKTPWLVGLSLVIGCGTIKADDRADGSRAANDAQPGDGAGGSTANDAGRGGSSSGGAGASSDAASSATDAGQDISVTDGAASADAPRSDGTSGNDVVTIDMPSLVDAPIPDTRGDILTSIDVDSNDGRGTGGSAGSDGSGDGGATGGTAGSGGMAGATGTGATGGTGGATGGAGGANGGMGGTSGGKDAGVDMGCVAETDAELCTKLAVDCEATSGVDKCGNLRSVDCGACSGALACVSHKCVTPVCSSFGYTGAVYPPFSTDGVLSFVITGSANGQSVLVWKSDSGCDTTNRKFILADESSPGNYALPTDQATIAFTDWCAAVNLGWAALSGDGLTLVVLQNSKTFVEAKRTALHTLDFGALNAVPYDAINAVVASGTGTFPTFAIAPNGLEFYFAITGDANIDGVYVATRANTSAAFSGSRKLTFIDPSYSLVSSVSSDGLAFFVGRPAPGDGTVFTRKSLRDDFSNPNGSNPPPQLQGWNHQALRGCNLLATWAGPTGGCQNNHVYLYSH